MTRDERHDITIRHAGAMDGDAVWSMLEPVLRAGETYALPREWDRADALGYWFGHGHEVFVAVVAGHIVGTYYLQANQRGGGARTANCGYITANGSGGRGVASAMCEHSLRRAAERGFRAMQFNFVVSTNERAVRLWQRHGFVIVGTLPQAFEHPGLGPVDAYVMHRALA